MTTAVALAGAAGATLLLCARSRAPILGGLALVGVAQVGLAAAFLDELGELEGASLSSSPGVVLAALAALLVLGGLAALLVRHPGATLPALLVAAPLRPPLDPDAGSPLLFTLRPDALVGYHLPLYVVLVAALGALAWRTLRGEPPRPLPGVIAYPTAALVALASVSLAWTVDREAGINEVLLFWLPYAALLAVVGRATLRAWVPRALAWTVVALGCAFALVGLGQVLAGEVFFSTPALAQANATTDLFRVTSLFQDPSIYGRELVLAMAVVLVALWVSRLPLRLGPPLLALLGAALYFTYSQSSFLALAVVALAVAAVAGDRRVRVLVAVLVATVVLASAAVLGVAAVGGDAGDLTRNRSTLVSETAVVFGNHPLAGVGIGGQPVATRDEADTGVSIGQSTSHTTPLTIAAELGLLGLIAYAALLVGTVVVLVRLRRSRPELALGLAAVLLALFVHALVYEGFFETALSWGAIGVACAALGSARPAAPEPRQPHASEAEPALT